MSAFEVVNLLVLIGVLLSAILTVQLRSLVASIAAFATVGTFLTVLFLLLQAPDVALSEAAVGAVAVPLVLLIALAKIRTLLDEPEEGM